MILKLKDVQILLQTSNSYTSTLLIYFRKYIRSMYWSWISTALIFNQLVKSSILKLDNKIENYYNYNGAECPNTIQRSRVSQYKLVSTNFYFLSKLSESGTFNRRKRIVKWETTRRWIKSEKIKKVSYWILWSTV